MFFRQILQTETSTVCLIVCIFHNLKPNILLKNNVIANHPIELPHVVLLQRVILVLLSIQTNTIIPTILNKVNNDDNILLHFT